MSVENKEIGWNNTPDIKKLLEKQDIDWALSWLGEVSNKTIENKEQELAGCFQIAEFTSQLNENETDRIQSILSQFLIPQNLPS